jgi:hypothetical protein
MLLPHGLFATLEVGIKTLIALANFSPRVCFELWDHASNFQNRNPPESCSRRHNSFRVAPNCRNAFLSQGLKQTLGWNLPNFGVKEIESREMGQ